MEPNLEQPLPLIPLAGAVVFPGGALEVALGAVGTSAFRSVGVGGHLVLSLRQGERDTFTAADAHGVGTLVRVAAFKEAGGGSKAAVYGIARVKIDRVEYRGDFLRATATRVDVSPQEPLSDAQMTQLRRLALRLYAAEPELPYEVVRIINLVKEPVRLVDALGANTLETLDDKQIILETVSVQQRYDRVYRQIERRLARLDGDGPSALLRVWRWWSTVTRHPEFNGWAMVAITAALAAVAIAWIHVHHPFGRIG